MISKRERTLFSSVLLLSAAFACLTFAQAARLSAQGETPAAQAPRGAGDEGGASAAASHEGAEKGELQGQAESVSDERPSETGPKTPTPSKQRRGPKTYRIVDRLFLDGSKPEPTPTPTPLSPPGITPFNAVAVSSGSLPNSGRDLMTSPSLPGSPEPNAAFLPILPPTATPTSTPTPSPSPTQTPTPTQTPQQVRSPASTKNPLDLNQATAEQLAALPGLDPIRARGIISHRLSISGFQRVDQLRDVFGVSEDLYRKIAPLLTVGPAPASLTKPPISRAPTFDLRPMPPGLPSELLSRREPHLVAKPPTPRPTAPTAESSRTSSTAPLAVPRLPAP